MRKHAACSVARPRRRPSGRPRRRGPNDPKPPPEADGGLGRLHRMPRGRDARPGHGVAAEPAFRGQGRLLRMPRRRRPATPTPSTTTDTRSRSSSRRRTARNATPSRPPSSGAPTTPTPGPSSARSTTCSERWSRGPAAAVAGCKQCHGAVVKVNADKTLDAGSWPNSGIGRINPDGSKGSCSACHSRHSFDAALARQPENCGKCHLGPDHPQKEIYEESKHGIAYYANIPRMNLHSASWVVGADYSAAPTCATCHISATKDLPMSHDVGGRISWTLRPAVSQKIDAAALKAGRTVKTWEARRTDMKKGLRQLPHVELRRQLLRPVRRAGQALQREIRDAGDRDLRQAAGRPAS